MTYDYNLLGLVVAGGTGKRLGASIPKQMLPLRGRPILAHTLQVFLDFAPEVKICTVLHASLLDEWPDFLSINFPTEIHPRLSACAGGSDRTASVANGLRQLQELNGSSPALVAIHDGVRPFVDRRMLADGFDIAVEKGNAVAGVPVKSSLRMLTDSGSSTAIDRSKFFHVQTPQIFQLTAIAECYAQRGSGPYTDDASLAEDQGLSIHLYHGSYDNIKITTPEDLLMAERLFDQKR
ncbi:MAG: 2-C-methyl-D-erythritol 4-phosphate cytidylyltransferase [Bacteroidota bacterium]